MAALTEATPRRTHGVYSWIQNYRVANGVTVYAGAFTGLPGASALTSNRGYLVLWQDESTIIWTGMAIGQSATNSLSTSNAVVGDTSASPVPEVSVECGPIVLEQASVTGVSAQTDVGRTAVYASNDNDMTTASSTYANAIGHVLYWHSGSSADVFIFGFQTQLGSLL
tara:strand:+ start:673 stop:1176 length:504 start_codon:yes stop_codon:yes gene_type:complete